MVPNSLAHDVVLKNESRLDKLRVKLGHLVDHVVAESYSLELNRVDVQVAFCHISNPVGLQRATKDCHTILFCSHLIIFFNIYNKEFLF